MRLLVADDVPAIRWLLTEVMGRDGWSITAAGDRAGVLAAARQQVPRVVLLDLGLAGADSVGVVRELRHLTPPPAIIIVTGHDDPEAILAPVRTDIQAVVKKPFDLFQLRDLVRGLRTDVRSKIEEQEL